MKKKSYSYDDLISCGNGDLFGPGNAKLPLPPMLMFDRITEINENNGAFNKGFLKAELNIKSLFPIKWEFSVAPCEEIISYCVMPFSLNQSIERFFVSWKSYCSY